MNSETRLELKLLGGFVAQLHGGAALILPTRKTQALLAYLALPLGQSHPRDKLATLLWGDMPDAQALGNLRHTLSRIKRALTAVAHPALLFDGRSVSLDPSLVDVDVARFERLIADGTPGALAQIGDVYRGDLLTRLTVTERPFEEWLTAERERLRELAIQGLGRLLAHQQDADAIEPAVQTALHLLALDPLQEPVHRAVMRFYMRLGRRDAALRQYQTCLDMLKRKLSTEPERETTDLYQHILRSRPVHGEELSRAATAPAASRPVATVVPTSGPPTNLPAPISELIGREAALAQVTDLLAAHRLVTLIGAGGVGKTRLGLELARQRLPDFADGVWFVELAPLSDPTLVPVTVATALGLRLPSGAESPERVASTLSAKHLLVVLDNCEHVIDAAARLAEALVRAGPNVRVMATSREPLRAGGEYLYRVPSLGVPAAESDDRDDLLAAPSVKLFVARAKAADARFSLDAGAAAATGAVCRRLDGIPLAIELAAARSATLGVEALAARLNDRFRLLSGGHRNALRRHQTLRATLDWSYELLPPIERTVLQRLAIFAGGFTLEAASAIVTAGDVDAPAVVDIITNLAAKSLVVVEVAGDVVRYRLLETTRAYALDKFTESGDVDRVARRHAEYFRDLLERVELEWNTRPSAEWAAVHGRRIDNIRAALDWAFSTSGDASIGVELTAAAIPLWFQHSLMMECRGRVERALERFGSGSGHDPGRRMKLLWALGVVRMHTKGVAAETATACTTALEIAEKLGDRDYQLRALWGLWHLSVGGAACRRSLALAESFSKVANAADLPIGEGLVGTSLYYLGQQTNARQYLERMLDRYVAPVRQADIVRFQYDQQVVARTILAQILWLQGFPDRARCTAQDNVEDARAVEHPASLCVALEVACLVAVWSGDLAEAERWVAMMLDCSARHALAVWHARGRCLNGVVQNRRGNFAAGFEVLRTALAELQESGFVQYHTALLGTLAESLAGVGQIDHGLETIDEALRRSERDGERWCVAELLRTKAELTLLERRPDAPIVAEEHFKHALQWSRRQAILSMELRCATGLARLWHARDWAESARDLLAPIYSRFTEGFGTADLRAAKALLESLS